MLVIIFTPCAVKESLHPEKQFFFIRKQIPDELSRAKTSGLKFSSFIIQQTAINTLFKILLR